MARSREEFIAAAKPRIQEIDVPEWNGMRIKIRELSADVLLNLGKEARDAGVDEVKASAKELVYSIVDDDGQLMFTEADIPLLLSFGSAGIMTVRRAINILNGITKDQTKN